MPSTARAPDTPKRYRLTLTLTRAQSSPIVDTRDRPRQSAILGGTLTYTLTSLDGKTVITQRHRDRHASYDRNPQRFATIRAARDAEIRLAKDPGRADANPAGGGARDPS